MLRYLGWDEAADLIITSLERTVASKVVTYDFHRLMSNATLVSTSGFAAEMVRNMG
jgi:isocitrate dehydrogenase